jgi:fumarylacetoacetase
VPRVHAYGVLAPAGAPPRVVVRAADGRVVDLTAVPVGRQDWWRAGTLQPLLAAGPATWAEVHEEVAAHLAAAPAAPEGALLLPWQLGDYVDFYSSREHAENLGRILRPGTEPLLPNWRHLPVGYHGRAGTVAVSGTPVVRPVGQRGPGDVGPSRRLDVEVEVGFVVGVPTEPGERVPTTALTDHVFGVVLVDDWSARDLQAWEYQPLGPFLSKSFLTSVSPWVWPLAPLLDAVGTPPPVQEPVPVDYLLPAGPGLALDLALVLNGTVVSRPPFAGTYWTAAQQLAHLTVGGAALRTGDLFASGTVSGPGRDQRGSLVELSWGGTEPVALDDGSTRTFLEDGDVVEVRGSTGGVDLGSVVGVVLPAR